VRRTRRLRWTRLARVDVDFFDALGTSILKGRDFERTDAEEKARGSPSSTRRS
jgi:hypothetical protein